MKQSSMLAQRYVRSLLDLSDKAKATDSVEKDMIDLQAMLAGSADLYSVFTSPAYSSDAQLAGLNAIAKKAKFHKLTVNFLGTLVQNRRTHDVLAILDAFFQELSLRKGVVDVHVQVAQDLSAKQVKALQEGLKKGLGHDVAIQAKVKPDLIGGLIVTVGSFMVDHSVKRKLETLKVAMGGHSNQNMTVSKKEA